MEPKYKKLIGVIVLIVGLTVYAFAAMGLGVAYVPEMWMVELLYYATAGVIWVWPAGKLIAWMSRPKASGGEQS
ncbi:MAG: DUF2842 domain-containing protein [Pseudomonadota bacterium]